MAARWGGSDDDDDDDDNDALALSRLSKDGIHTVTADDGDSDEWEDDADSEEDVEGGAVDVVAAVAFVLTAAGEEAEEVTTPASIERPRQGSDGTCTAVDATKAAAADGPPCSDSPYTRVLPFHTALPPVPAKGKAPAPAPPLPPLPPTPLPPPPRVSELPALPVVPTLPVLWTRRCRLGCCCCCRWEYACETSNGRVRDADLGRRVEALPPLPPLPLLLPPTLARLGVYARVSPRLVTTWSVLPRRP